MEQYRPSVQAAPAGHGGCALEVPRRRPVDRGPGRRLVRAARRAHRAVARLLRRRYLPAADRELRI